MVLHPEIAKKAQAELDDVVGQDRLPDFSDKAKLPYVCAVVNEVMRWNPVTPAGVPRRLMADDIYNGYLLPKGAIVLGNIWSVTTSHRSSS